MNILPLIVIALGCFGAGSLLIFKAYQQDADAPVKDQEPGVVPISDQKEIDALKQNFAPPEPEEKKERSMDAIAADLFGADRPETTPVTKEEKRPTLSLLQEEPHEQETELRHQLDQLKYRMKEQEEELKAKIVELTDDKRKLEDALKREMDSKEPVVPAGDGTQEKEQLEDRLSQAEILIKSLTQENQGFNEHFQTQQDEINMLKNEIVSLQAEVENSSKLDLQDLKVKEEKLQEAEGSVIRLMAETQRLNEQVRLKDQEVEQLNTQIKGLNEKTAESDAADPQLLMKLEEKLAEAQGGNAHLLEEKQRMADQIHQQQDQVERLTQDISTIRGRFEEIETNAKIKMEAFQHELETQKQHMFEERQADLAAIDKLRNERQSLLDREEQHKERIGSLETKIKDMNTSWLEETAKQKLEIKAEQDAVIHQLKSQLEENAKKQNEQEHQARRAKETYEEKIFTLHEEVDALKKVQDKGGAEESKNAAQALQEQIQQLKADAEKLNQSNALFAEKEKMLVYELSKSRAQAQGLERICKDLKRQLDQGSGQSA